MGSQAREVRILAQAPQEPVARPGFNLDLLNSVPTF